MGKTRLLSKIQIYYSGQFSHDKQQKQKTDLRGILMVDKWLKEVEEQLTGPSGQAAADHNM